VPLYAGSGRDYAEVYLNNGDKISGVVVFEDKNQIKIENSVIGGLSIKKDGVKEVAYAKKEAVSESKAEEKGFWSGDFSIGYDKSGGNTKDSNLAIRLYCNRKTDINEFTIKGDMFYSSANDKMDAQKWYNMLRYAYSFRERKWYNFYKIENDHDRFANIAYRIVPSLGTGYWLSDFPDLKLMVEFGVGLEHTKFRHGAKDQNEAVLLPRALFEKAVFRKSRVVQEVSLYPSLTEAGKYRLHSETVFINPINKKLALRLSLIEDYNSDPSGDTKKSDYRFISSLSYFFRGA
jgi:putative salt-induced outer membrane protein YdiY